MKIEEISIIAFRDVHDIHIDTPSLNQILNVQSDMTAHPISDFLLFLFYNTNEALNPQSDFRAGSVVFSTKDGKRYKLSRELRLSSKEDSSDLTTLIDLQEKRPLSLSCTPGDYFFGVPKEVFCEMALLTSNSAALTANDRLSDMILPLFLNDGANQSIDDTIRRIDEAKSSLLHTNMRGGVIFELEKKAAELQKRITDSKSASRRITDIENSLADATAQRADAENSIQKLKELDTAYQDLSLIQAYDNLHALEDELDAARREHAVFGQKNQIENFLPDNDYLTEIQENRRNVALAARKYAISLKNQQHIEEEFSLDAVNQKYIEKAESFGGFSAVRDAASSLSRRSAKDLFFSFLSLFVAAFLIVSGLLARKGAPSELSLVLFLLAATAIAATAVFFNSHLRFANALLLLCRDYGTKYKSELLARLHFLEAEQARHAQHNDSVRIARQVTEQSYLACKNALHSLTDSASKWGNHIAVDKISDDLEALEQNVLNYINENEALVRHIHECEQKVQAARARLANRNEIAVRALVSPAKRKNLLFLKKEGRLQEIAYGISLYSQQIESFDLRINELNEERTQVTKSICDLGELDGELTELKSRILSLRTAFDAYSSAKFVLSDANESMNDEVRQSFRELLAHFEKSGVSSPLASSLALRLTFVKQGFQEPPPLFIDTPILNDDESAIFDALAHIASGAKCQIIRTAASTFAPTDQCLNKNSDANTDLHALKGDSL